MPSMNLFLSNKNNDTYLANVLLPIPGTPLTVTNLLVKTAWTSSCFSSYLPTKYSTFGGGN